MAGAVLGLRTHVQDHHLATLEPFSQLSGGQLLDLGALAQIIAGEHGYLGDMLGRHIAHRAPQLGDAIAGKPVHDAVTVAPRPQKTRTRKQPQVMRRVCKALLDLGGDLLD